MKQPFLLIVLIGTIVIVFFACVRHQSESDSGNTISKDRTTDPGVVINGITWATRNVDAPGTFAETPESSGMLYQWNRKVGWPAKGSVSDWDTSYPSGTEWEPANDPCPEGWRVPTLAELKTLDNKPIGCIEGGTSRNGVSGRSIICGTDTIFLPIAGMRQCNGDRAMEYEYRSWNPDIRGHYWSSSGFHLNFGLSGWCSGEGISRCCAASVRCVAK